ncbi:virulence protein [Capnocytophaga sp. Marseille-Q4570]|jgi:virulence-associated protein D homolog|uniref:Endoribonuclease VapD n=1 Tax=Capnocytophaga bilenii TaxID=2819369 RepID=A0ABS3PW48_9FLAO|nr:MULTISPECIES: virulence protein [Capnocytophaga]EKY11368.1 Virulence-associated protein D conserved region [Capnocytophaga sp. oral taxon 332 str. F0381]MBO1883546.1 virulence protein [Capnocytophaga bilenii]
MYAIAFDLIISELKKHYKDPYNNAYAEVKKVLEENGFFWIQGSTYATEGNLKVLFRAIQSLKNLRWFCLSVRDIRAFKIEDYSDFTEEFKLTI